MLLAPACPGRMVANAHEGDYLEVGSGHAHPSSAVLFVGVVLLIGIATRNLMQRVPVPYTALLLVSGSRACAGACLVEPQVWRRVQCEEVVSYPVVKLVK